MTIRVDYDNAMAQARRLQTLAQEQQRAVTALSRIRGEVAQAWQEPAAADYDAAVAQLAASLETTNAAVSRLATGIESAARKLRAQQEATAIAARRLQT